MQYCFFCLLLVVALGITDATLTEAHHVHITDLRTVLLEVAQKVQSKYDMSIALAFKSSEKSIAVAAGFTDEGLGLGIPKHEGQPNDRYVWGSTTKMFTGPAVLQLVEQGIVALSDPVSKHVDPLLMHLNGTKLSDHFGLVIETIQVRHLLHMTSGLSDYDGEAYAKDQFRNRSRDFTPIEIISRYVDSKLRFNPGTRQSYCSTNYILLGLVLANHLGRSESGDWSWKNYDQMSVVPEKLRPFLQSSVFVNTGTCEQHTPVHGFMEGYSTAALMKQDVWNVSCAGGYTAGNYLGSVGDVAEYTYALYSRGGGIVSHESQQLMTNFTAPHNNFKFYGMGTFSLDWSVGDAVAYGHVGDTYGYQSQTTYFPEHDFVLTVATNVETDSQAQPADATCVAYHDVIALMNNKAPPNCTFVVPHRFIGTCSCIY